MERTLRTRITLLGAATLLGVASSCTGWLLDWSGTRCDRDADCGGTLVCSAQKTCEQKGSSGADGASDAPDGAAVGDGDAGAAASNDTGGADPDGGAVSASDTGPGPRLDAAEPGRDAAGPDASTLEPPDAAAQGQDAATTPASLHNCGSSSGICYQTIGGAPLAVSALSETDVWVVGKDGMAQHWDGFKWTAVSIPPKAWDAGWPDAGENLSVVRAVAGQTLIASEWGRVLVAEGAAAPAEVFNDKSFAIRGGWAASKTAARVVGDGCNESHFNAGKWTGKVGCGYSNFHLLSIDGDQTTQLAVGHSAVLVRYEGSDLSTGYLKVGSNSFSLNTNIKSVKVFGPVQYATHDEGSESNFLKCQYADAGFGLSCVRVATEARPDAVWGASATDVYYVGGYGFFGHYDGATPKTLDYGSTTDDLVAIDGFGTDGVVAVGANGTVMTYKKP